MKKLKSFSLIFIILLVSSCSTMNKTLIYSSIAGAVLGGFIGKELSPDRDSDAFNTVIGATTGAALTTAVGYYFYKDANPALDLKQSPLKEDIPMVPIPDQSFGQDKLRIVPKIGPTGKKEYLKFSDNLPDEIKLTAKKQYFKKYKTEAYSFDQDGRTYQIPSFEVIENGVE